MKCENCKAYNAHVIRLEDERMLLCPRCLGIFKNLSNEYYDIVRVNELTSSEHSSKEDA